MLDSPVEIIAVLTALFYVILAAKANRSCFIFGFISSAIYIYICLNLHFYFDALINLFYVIVSIAGWLNWGTKKTEEEFVTKANKNVLILFIGIGLILTFSLAHFAERFSNAELPYLDAFTTVFSLIASWMLIKRQIENWLFWIAIDSVATYMYFVKGLTLTAGLFIIYTVLAIYGFSSWKKKAII